MIFRSFAKIFWITIGLVDCSELCEKETLPQNVNYNWDCEMENGQTAIGLGVKCRLVCKEGLTTKTNIETTCTEVGWTDSYKSDLGGACAPSEGCFNVLKEGSYNGHWECSDQMSKKCLYPKKGSLCELMCDENYHHSHGKTSVCTAHGWVPGIENYRCLTCAPPMKPLNGQWRCEISSSTNQTVCFLTCDSGYIIKDVAMLNCEAGGEYNPSPDTATCQPVHPKPLQPQTRHGDQENNLPDDGCHMLNKPDFGRFECENDVCRLVCDPGDSAPAVVSATCIKGEWCTQDFGIGCRSVEEITGSGDRLMRK